MVPNGWHVRPCQAGDIAGLRAAHEALIPVDYDDSYFKKVCNHSDRIFSFCVVLDEPPSHPPTSSNTQHTSTTPGSTCKATGRSPECRLLPSSDHNEGSQLLGIVTNEGPSAAEELCTTDHQVCADNSAHTATGVQSGSATCSPPDESDEGASQIKDTETQTHGYSGYTNTSHPHVAGCHATQAKLRHGSVHQQHCATEEVRPHAHTSQPSKLVAFAIARTGQLGDCDYSDLKHLSRMIQQPPSSDLKLQVTYLLTIGVLPEYQRQGFASLLLRSVVSESIAKNSVAIFLHVGAYNSEACLLYNRLHFQHLHTYHQFYTLKANRAPTPGQLLYDAYLFALPLCTLDSIHDPSNLEVSTSAAAASSFQAGFPRQQTSPPALDMISWIVTLLHSRSATSLWLDFQHIMHGVQHCIPYMSRVLQLTDSPLHTGDGRTQSGGLCLRGRTFDAAECKVLDRSEKLHGSPLSPLDLGRDVEACTDAQSNDSFGIFQRLFRTTRV